MAIQSKIVSLEEEDDFVNLLVYGMSGAGKTVFGGSGKNVLFLAPEDDGTLSAKRMGSKAQKWPIKKWSDLQEAYDWLEENEDSHGFDWIVIDSATEMQQMLLRDILESANRENEKRDLDIPALADHQKWQNKFKRFVKAFNALPINVLWLALARSEEDQNKEDFLCPDIAGKKYQMAQAFASYMTSYGYLEVAERVYANPRKDEEGQPKTVTRKVRQITWEDTGTIRGKDRTGRLAPTTINKSLADLTKMIFAEPEPKKAPPKPPVKPPVDTPVEKAEVTPEAPKEGE